MVHRAKFYPKFHVKTCKATLYKLTENPGACRLIKVSNKFIFNSSEKTKYYRINSMDGSFHTFKQ